jgi:hypothetical protein
MRRLRTSAALFLLALTAALTFGCGAKTDYSDTNPPVTNVSSNPSAHPTYMVSTGARQLGAVQQRMKSMVGQANHGRQ